MQLEKMHFYGPNRQSYEIGVLYGYILKMIVLKTLSKILASVVVVFLLISLVFVISAIKEKEKEDAGDMVTGTGTVIYMSMEGGFYGILSDDGEHYDPVNLEQEFKVDGLRVSFEAKILRNYGSIHMWGRIISILKIQRL